MNDCCVNIGLTFLKVRFAEEVSGGNLLACCINFVILCIHNSRTNTDQAGSVNHNVLQTFIVLVIGLTEVLIHVNGIACAVAGNVVIGFKAKAECIGGHNVKCDVALNSPTAFDQEHVPGKHRNLQILRSRSCSSRPYRGWQERCRLR